MQEHPSVSVVVTTRNEGKSIGALLASLARQEFLHEVLLVDAESTDDTVAIAQETAHELHIPLTVVVQACKRGEGRNIGIQAAAGNCVAFIDGDCIAHQDWLKELAKQLEGPHTVVAGETQWVGRSSFQLGRVPLVAMDGQDIGWPSCNLLYPKQLLLGLGGFDPELVTAEDMELNLRAVRHGATIVHAPRARVQARTREDLRGFLKQAYWNGVGRRQMTAKQAGQFHWQKGSNVTKQFFHPLGLARFMSAGMGYVFGGRR